MNEEILKLARFKLEWVTINQDPRLLIALAADEARAVINHIDTLEATLKAYEDNGWIILAESDGWGSEEIE